MNAEQLKMGRKNAGLTQNQAAAKLGVSQPYLCLLEAGLRAVPARLARKVASLYRLPATALPVEDDLEKPPATTNDKLAEELAALGYPGFSHLRCRKKRNPAELLFTALGQSDLDPRVTEALPWVVLNYADLDWEWLLPRAKTNDLQNRLGFITGVAHRLAVSRQKPQAALLGHREDLLRHARLAVEGTLCHESLTEAEKTWLRERRPDEAKYWNLLTDLTPEDLANA